MKNLVNLSGSIAKKEILVSIDRNILENTSVSEACGPYANYYGQMPQKAKPNSIFIFTSQFYYLEEILSCAVGAEECLTERINIASAHIYYGKKQYPAIRIKHFANYSQIIALQQCLMSKGIKFSLKNNIIGEVEARINKLFVLEKVGDAIYMDLEEDNKGYFFLPQKLSPDKFEQISTSVKNSSTCKLFDAVQGEIIQDGNVLELVRVFAEGLDVAFLNCMNQEFARQLTTNKYAF